MNTLHNIYNKVKRTIVKCIVLTLPLYGGVGGGLLLGGCTHEMSMTRVAVQDSIRHYYPLVQGTPLTLVWKVTNVGSAPLVITDVQPSCGCIEEDPEQTYVIVPGKEEYLKFTFHSEKYCGYVHHTIRLFGNIEPEGMAALSFDTNVVPSATANYDYEELYKAQKELERTSGGDKKTEEMLQDEMTRGYWVKKGKTKSHSNR